MRDENTERENKRFEERIQELTEKLNYEMEEGERTRISLESELDSYKTERSKSIEDQKKNAELSLMQLKNYYEMEKERLEKKNLEERKKH